MIRPTFMIVTLLLAACTSNRARPPEAVGAWRPLNAGRWQPTRDDLRGPRQPLAPAQSWSLSRPESPR